MDPAADVERMFSWLKTPDLKYREFAGAREVSDAVASWPVLHKAAATSGQAVEAAAPQGDDAARERKARQNVTIPPSMPPAGAPPRHAGALAEIRRDQPNAGESTELRTALVHRLRAGLPDMPASVSDPATASVTVLAPPAPPRPAAAPAAVPPAIRPEREPAGDVERGGPARPRERVERPREESRVAAVERPAPVAPSGAAAGPLEPPRDGLRDRPPVRRVVPLPSPRGSLFGGAYRRSGERVASNLPDLPDRSRSARSLQSVFSRLSGGEGAQRATTRDPRAGDMAGLGAVFNRLR
jgi:hypothetical protein